MGTQPEPILELSVIELRRLATRYLDRQGTVAQSIPDRYGIIGFDAGAVRITESLTLNLPEDNTRGVVNGHNAGYEQSRPTDIAAFERESRLFFRCVEKEIAPKVYDRVGILFRFAVQVDNVDAWAKSTIGITNLSKWTVSEIGARLTASTEEWQPMVTVHAQQGQTDDDSGSPGRLLIDVDQYQFQVSPNVALNLPVQTVFNHARSLLTDLLGGDDGDGSGTQY